MSAKQLFPVFVKDESHLDCHCVLISRKKKTLSMGLKDFRFLASAKLFGRVDGEIYGTRLDDVARIN